MKARHFTNGLTFVLTIVLLGCSSKSIPTKSALPTNAQKTETKEQIRASALDLGTRVAKWQVDKIEQNDYSYLAERYHHSSSNPIGWIQAAFYIGLAQWAETTDDEALLKHMSTVAETENYRLRLSRGKHADDHAIGQMYLWLTEQTGNTRAYGPTKKLFDNILANPSTVNLDMKQGGPKRWAYESPCQDRWCWADALFMAPRTWLKLSNILNDPRYFEFADKEFWATSDYLFSDKYGLFFRDSRYFDLKSDNGQPVFWSRGNGWVFAALPLIIDDLPKNHSSRDRYIELYKRHAAGLVRAQTQNGYWPASLLDPNKVNTPEVSGTGFITFGLAWGVNKGILREAKYTAAVKQGWQAIRQSVQPDGRVNWVQQVGKSPDPVSKHETQLYGVGAVLLAASEMLNWQEAEHNYIVIEAEDYESQHNDDIRRWFIFNAETPQANMSDSDPNHAQGASAGSYIEILPDTRTTHDDELIRGQNFTIQAGTIGVLKYPVFFDRPGTYYVWARAFSTGSEDNGVHIGLNDQWPESGKRLQLCQGKHQWTWSSAQRTKENHCGTPKTITLNVPSKGVHNIMISMREDGFELDKLLLTTNPNYSPSGLE